MGVILLVSAQNTCTDGGLSDQYPYKSTHRTGENTMKRHLIVLTILCGCSTEANHIGNPLLLPLSALSTGISNAAYNQRRGQVEIYVKSNHTAIMGDIVNGGGDHIARAMDIAGIAPEDRPTRLIQLKSDQGLYQTSPEALITALMVYG
ncbi:hypothetical protein SAMN04488005_1310 [Yoonia tamlensis]|uniref:Uncharacterized protein n=2 Tax=Yoonia tamlensis TaxID=390270 RepID=A0A1I6GA99_9RHOB|nr:hypothetical protein SAMN04488005_1310 [Yoonia tamlensis]